MSMILTRRALVTSAAASMLAGCDKLARNESFRDALFTAENFHQWSQRSLSNRHALAREFSPEDMSPFFRANGTRNPKEVASPHLEFGLGDAGAKRTDSSAEGPTNHAAAGAGAPNPGSFGGVGLGTSGSGVAACAPVGGSILVT